MPSNYVARKLTRHYYGEVAKFLAERGDREIEAFRSDVADALSLFAQDSNRGGKSSKLPPKPKFENGDYFFAAIVSHSADLVAQYIVIGAFLEYGPGQPPDGSPGQPASVSHIAINEGLLAANPDVLSGFFQLLHRSAAVRNKTQLTLKTALDSPLPRFLTRKGYHIVSHEFEGDSHHMKVRFRTDIVPVFTGDVLKWTPLCRWYLSLSFGQFHCAPTAVGASKQENHSIEIRITPSCLPERSDVLPTLRQLSKQLLHIPVNAVIVPNTDLQEPDVLASELGSRLHANKYNIALLNCLERNKPELLPLPHQCSIVYRDEVEDLVRSVRGLYFAKPGNQGETERWKRLLQLKVGFRRQDRNGIIVEIDRASYVALLQKLKSKPDATRFLFLNDGGFGEAVQPDCAVFFYVWDALGSSAKTDVPGVVVALGRVAEVKVWTLEQLNTAWDEISIDTIWKDKFVEQYFSEPIVGLFIDSLECIGVDEDGDGDRLAGIAYDALLPQLFSTLLPEKQEDLRTFQELLPTWDIKNSYLDDDLTAAVTEDLRKRGKRIKKYIAKPEGLGQPAIKPATQIYGAAHWIGKSPRALQEQPADVFFSFAGADEESSGWKTHVVRSMGGGLTAAGFQPPYTFDEAAKRNLGQVWTEVLVERMSTCRTALILWSPNYLSSSTCFQLELPYLLWRRKQGMPLYFLRLMETAGTTFKWEGIDLGESGFDVSSVNDDRMAVTNSTSWPNAVRDATLQELRDEHKTDMINQRLQGTLEQIIESLKQIRSRK